MLRIDALAETMFINLTWSWTCSARSRLIAVIQRAFSISLCNVLVVLLRNRKITYVICYGSRVGTTIFSGLKALHHTRYTSNSCIHFSRNIRANIRHWSVTREKPLLPPSGTLWNWLFVSKIPVQQALLINEQRKKHTKIVNPKEVFIFEIIPHRHGIKSRFQRLWKWLKIWRSCSILIWWWGM